jgi:hypothetical protein
VVSIGLCSATDRTFHDKLAPFIVRFRLLLVLWYIDRSTYRLFLSNMYFFCSSRTLVIFVFVFCFVFCLFVCLFFSGFSALRCLRAIERCRFRFFAVFSLAVSRMKQTMTASVLAVACVGRPAAVLHARLESPGERFVFTCHVVGCCCYFGLSIMIIKQCVVYYFVAISRLAKQGRVQRR